MMIYFGESKPSWDMKLYETAMCALFTFGFILFSAFVIVKNFVPDPPPELHPDPILTFADPPIPPKK